MKHINLALEKLEERIAPWGPPTIGVGVGVGVNGNANAGGDATGHDGGPSNRSQKSAKSNRSGKSNNSVDCG